MPACPCCFGDGGLDLRDTNAFLKEHLTDRELAHVEGLDQDWLDCDECEATGVVSVARAAEIHEEVRGAAMRAFRQVEVLEQLRGEILGA